MGSPSANGKIYFSRTNNNLSSMTFGGTAPVPGTETLVSPASAGTNWASGGLFVFSRGRVRHHAADGARATNRAKPRCRQHLDQLGGLHGCLTTDHLSDLSGRRPDRDRFNHEHVVHG